MRRTEPTRRARQPGSVGSAKGRAAAPATVLAVGVALTLALGSCGGKEAAPIAPTNATQSQAQPQNVPRRQVRTVSAVTGTLTTTRSTSVTIEPAKQADVASGATGRVAEVLKRQGAVVGAGDVVVRLDASGARSQLENARLALRTAQVNLDKAVNAASEGAQQAEAALRTAKANVDVLQRQVDSARQLYGAGGISANDLAGLEAQLTQAQAAVLQANDGVAKANRAGGEDLALLRLQVDQAGNQVRQAERAVADTSITAPFAGEIAALMVEQGEFVATGSPVFRLASNDRQLARFQVPPSDASALVTHGEVHVRYAGLDYAGHIIHSSELPGTSRLVEITAELYQASTRIPTGTIAQLNYTVDLATGLQLPAAAVRTDGDSSTVLIVQDGVATKVSVRPVAEVGGTVVVDDLPPDAAVIYPIPADLRAGTPVAVTSGGTAP